jgi:hypothetical protein
MVGPFYGFQYDAVAVMDSPTHPLAYDRTLANPRHRAEELEESRALGLCYPSSAFGDKQSVCYFERPNNWCKPGVFIEVVPNTLRVSGNLIGKAPSHGHGVIQNEWH